MSLETSKTKTQSEEDEDAREKWFDGLSNRSITCFHDFKTVFLRHFASSRKYQKIDHYLFALKQGFVQPFRSYIKRFNQVAQDISSATSEILMSAFSYGLVEGEFFQDLIREPVKNFDEMLGKAASYVNVEEAQAARQKADKAPAPTNKPKKRSPQPSAQPLPRVQDARPQFPLGQDSRLAQRVPIIQAPRPSQWRPHYFTYHRSHTHATSDCFQFARDSQHVAKLGLSPPKIAPKIQRLLAGQQPVAGQSGKPLPDNTGQGSQQPGRNQEPREAREEENKRNMAIREIGMISEGPTDGDSARAQKSHERRLEIHVIGCSREQAAGPIISFGP
ncbi:uncharacterized protein LOC122011056 [Zingiber officinale]|uniref:uncharacterized protein LOC122011056 n=1 Tax=Zingiber officinale TaxID=94328 RepID=UPI001C4C386B|nr:uncharacterized protein LOC122011056 [Zingiber officinale]